MAFEKTWDDMLVTEEEYQDTKTTFYVHIGGDRYTKEELMEELIKMRQHIESCAKTITDPYGGRVTKNVRREIEKIQLFSEQMQILMRMIDEYDD